MSKEHTPETVKNKKLGMVNAHMIQRIMAYSQRYEISMQLWPNQKVVFLAKDGVDLTSYGCEDINESMDFIIKYLDRVNRLKP